MRSAAVRAFAAPHDSNNVTELRRALASLADELRRARGVDDKPTG